MNRILVILEVSRKQDYIFGDRGMGLKEYIRRSRNISQATDSAFFQSCAAEFYREEENLVYFGGGHAVLQFDGREQAVAFTKAVTLEAMKRWWGMELFAAQMPYDPARMPGENLEELGRKLERKKAKRVSSFRQLSFGMEELYPGASYRPMLKGADYGGKREPLQEDPRYIRDFERLESGLVAVVHADGNAMGERIRQIYAQEKDWEACCARMRRFSTQIREDFEGAFRDTVERLAAERGDPNEMPIRPIVLAGDDVCFVTDAKYGLECARLFLEHLAGRENMGRPYAACAGICIADKNVPFDLMYNRAEALCSSAKRFGAEIDPLGGVSTMDWQVESQQIKGTLSEVRRGYETEDGARLELRPVTVRVPPELEERAMEITGGLRTYRFFRACCKNLKRTAVSRKKLFRLRSVMRQGEVETRFAVAVNKMETLYDCVPDGERRLFAQIGERRRALLYDAMEQSDMICFLGEVAR